jgi:hypothetical protein
VRPSKLVKFREHGNRPVISTNDAEQAKAALTTAACALSNVDISASSRGSAGGRQQVLAIALRISDVFTLSSSPLQVAKREICHLVGFRGSSRVPPSYRSRFMSEGDSVRRLRAERVSGGAATLSRAELGRRDLVRGGAASNHVPRLAGCRRDASPGSGHHRGLRRLRALRMNSRRTVSAPKQAPRNSL